MTGTFSAPSLMLCSVTGLSFLDACLMTSLVTETEDMIIGLVINGINNLLVTLVDNVVGDWTSSSDELARTSHSSSLSNPSPISLAMKPSKSDSSSLLSLMAVGVLTVVIGSVKHSFWLRLR